MSKHQNTVAAAARKPRSGHAHRYAQDAEVFRVLSAPLRLDILSQLGAGELNATELLQRIPTTQSNLSQHLSALSRAGLLVRRRDGIHAYYRLVEPLADRAPQQNPVVSPIFTEILSRIS